MPSAADTVFRESRWRRAGATVAQLDRLRAAHEQMTADERLAEGARVDGVSDSDLAIELDAGEDDPTAGTVEEVLARVGDDPALAAVVLSHEQAKPTPRKGVVEPLSALVEGQQPSGD